MANEKNKSKKKGRKPMAKLLKESDVNKNCLIAHLPIKIDSNLSDVIKRVFDDGLELPHQIVGKRLSK